MTTFIDPENVPEGLHLTFAPNGDGEPCITDAQDIVWIRFGSGGNGDPVSWRNSVIAATCKALGVRSACSLDGSAFGDPEWFIREYLDDEDGFNGWG